MSVRCEDFAIFVPTKDRPMQVDALLNSIFTNLFAHESPRDIYLLVKSSNFHIRQCYEDLAAHYQNLYGGKILIRHEYEFHDNFLDCLEHLSAQYHFALGFVDDCVVHARPNFSFYKMLSPFNDPNVFTVSLRLGKNTTKQDPEDESKKIVIPTPFSSEGVATWSWRLGNPNYNVGYPVSLDGHFYRSADLYKLSQNIPFQNLREWEGEAINFVRNNKTVPHMMSCFEQSIIVCITSNMVQYPYHKTIGPYGQTVEELQVLFDRGMRVDLHKTLDNVTMDGSHKYIPLAFKNFND